MAIVKMSLFELITFNNKKEDLIKDLQKFDYVHLDNVKEKVLTSEELIKNKGKTPEKVVAINEEVDKVKNALDLLYSYDSRPKGLEKLRIGNPNLTFEELENLAKTNNWEESYFKTKEIKDKLEEIKVHETKVRGALEEINNWTSLDISPREISKLKNLYTVIGSIPKKFEDTLLKGKENLKLSYLEKVGESKTDFFYLIIAHKSEEEELVEILRNSAFSEIRLDYDEEPLVLKKKLNEEILEVKRLENETKENLREVAKNIGDLEIAYEFLQNKKMRIMAEDDIYDTEYLSIINGYVPEDKKEDLIRVLNNSVGNNYSIEFREVLKDDEKVPVLLKNNKFNEVFESITNMYALPHYNEIDPTPLLAPFYMIFFGMMIGDAGYGIILWLLTFFALKKFNLSKSMRNSVRFFHYLSYPTIIWGMIYGSYLSLDIPVPKLIDPAKDFQFLLILSMIIGLGHLFFSLGVKAYMLFRDGKPLDAVLDVFLWYLTLTGALVFLAGGFIGLSPTIINIAKIAMIIGMVGIVLFAARDAAGWGGRIAGGLYSLYGISSWVGDIVSYSRLMALGLSGAFIGMAFNMIAKMVGSAWYMIPVMALIFIIGHVFNLFLSALGAYVHTLRLTYVESFGKFYEGGGVRFKKLRSEPKYINYTDEVN